ncbi:MAG: ATP-binding cassette domain-containing protein [Clostridia bacterium]|nr:ATP-binding cassette domain-containing protein [Clostridia bacterium]
MELKLENLTKRYGRKAALDGFCYTFGQGICGILGANGAGKSTMMNLITDNVSRDEGSILFNGKEVLELGSAFRSMLGYMPQQQGMYDEMSAYSFLLYIAKLKGVRGREAKAQAARLLSLVNLSDSAHKKLGGFSGGMRQRVLLCQALLGSPQIIILDEPTAGLDPKERVRIRNYVHDLAKQSIVLWTTHIVSDIESIADDVILMQKGKLVAHGRPDELVASVNGRDLEDVYMHYLGEDEPDA